MELYLVLLLHLIQSSSSSSSRLRLAASSWGGMATSRRDRGRAPTRSEASRRRRGTSVERSATLYVYCLSCYFTTELWRCSS
jgi:hypothetical protein